MYHCVIVNILTIGDSIHGPPFTLFYIFFRKKENIYKGHKRGGVYLYGIKMVAGDTSDRLGRGHFL